MRLTHRTTPIALLSLLLVLVSACGSPSGGVDRRAILLVGYSGLGEVTVLPWVPTWGVRPNSPMAMTSTSSSLPR